MEQVTVQISKVWERRVNSPLFLVVCALSGVSAGFAPLFLYQLGESKAGIFSPWVLLNFAIIYFVSWFDAALAMQVLAQLHKQKRDRMKTTADSE